MAHDENLIYEYFRAVLREITEIGNLKMFAI